MSGDEAPVFHNLRELEPLARERIDRTAFDYIAGGAGDEATLVGNEAGWDRYRLLHRALHDVSGLTLEQDLLGQPTASPVLVAPTAFHRLVHPEGEVATATGAARSGHLMVASTLSTTPLEAIADASPERRWFQLYVYEDRALTEQLVDRAEAAGYEAIVVTVDAPVWGRRERDVRNNFSLPDGMGLANFPDLDQEDLPKVEGDRLAAYVEDQLDASLTWAGIEWLTELTDLPVLVKGIVHPADARAAIDHGVAGLVVSNHGGRQLDHGVPTAHALPEVVDAVDGDIEILVDGGIRRGTDVVKALALGADAVLVGRPVLWALALDGSRGVGGARDRRVAEVGHAMAGCGAQRPADRAPDQVREAKP